MDSLTSWCACCAVYAPVWFDAPMYQNTNTTQQALPQNSNINGDDDKLHRSCEMGARNVDMNPVVDALLGVRLMINDCPRGRRLGRWPTAGIGVGGLDGTSCRSSSFKLQGRCFENGRATTVERKHQPPGRRSRRRWRRSRPAGR